MKTSTLIACISPVEGSGCKYASATIASALRAKYPKAKIALVDFDLANPYLLAEQTMNDRVHGIDNLLDKISAEVLTQDLFKENMIKIGSEFDFLKGTKRIGRENYFTKKHILKTIELLRQTYEYIVVAIPPRENNSATIFTLNSADHIVMVVRPNVANLMNINDTISACKKLRHSTAVDVNVLYNMRASQNDIEPFSKSINENDVRPIGYMSFDPNTVDNQNIGGSFLKDKIAKIGKKNENLARVKEALNILLSSDTK